MGGGPYSRVKEICTETKPEGNGFKFAEKFAYPVNTNNRNNNDPTRNQSKAMSGPLMGHFRMD